jgi:membrane-bound metal-dependent hydrolase YbcI (DUF457 family)
MVDFISGMPRWLIVCFMHSLAGVAVASVGYILGIALNKAVDPIIIVLGGFGGLLLGIYELSQN